MEFSNKLNQSLNIRMSYFEASMDYWLCLARLLVYLAFL